MNLRRVTLLLTTVMMCAMLVATGCNKPRKRVLTKEQAGAIESAILKAEPKPQKAIGAILDNKLELIGVDISAAEVKVGGSFKATYYWRVLENLPPGNWMIFVHMDGSKRTNHDHQGVNELLPLNKWKKGQIIKDEQTISVANDFQNGTARLFIGVFDEAAWRERKANVRLKVVNRDKVKVPVDPDDRIEVARIRFTGSTAKPGKRNPRGANRNKARRYAAVHTAGAQLTVDGQLNDAAWRKARPTPPFVTPGGARSNVKMLTQARLTWDDTNLYVGFTARDEDIFADLKGRDAKLWERDVVEIYLDPGADGRDYVELQISPNGDIFDAHFSTQRKPDWPTAAKKLTLGGMVAKVSVNGTVNKQDDKDRQWTVEASIPWKELPGVKAPPKEGETWSVNMYRIDGNKKENRTFLAWTPAGGDFHNLRNFGKVTFTRKQPSAARGPRALPTKRAPTANPAARRMLKPGAALAPRTGPGAVAPKKVAPVKPGAAAPSKAVPTKPGAAVPAKKAPAKAAPAPAKKAAPAPAKKAAPAKPASK